MYARRPRMPDKTKIETFRLRTNTPEVLRLKIEALCPENAHVICMGEYYTKNI